MAITVDQAREYLEGLGFTNVPDFILEAWVDMANEIIICMDANGYPSYAQILILSYLIALLASMQGDRYISSQTAPSGASQSFRYMTLSERYKYLTGLIKSLDPNGCANALIPDDPDKKNTYLNISSGGCDCE